MSDPNSIIDSETAATILKWAGGILIAGFIAQFGKKFANYLMEKAKTARGGKDRGDAAQSGSHAAQQGATDNAAAAQAAAEKARLKLEKKKSKNLAKKRKK